MIICQRCGREYEYNRSKGHIKSVCNSCVVNTRRFTVKQKCIEYKGGKCKICGYNKSHRALTFHHEDPTKKDFEISGNHALSWIKLKNELDKCVLLCMNCHMEEHEKLDNTLKTEYIPTIRIRKVDKCEICSKEKYITQKFCSKVCLNLHRNKKWNNIDLQEMLETKSITEIAKELSVSTRYIYKRIKKLGI